MSSISEYFSGLFGGIKSLLTGMRITWGELWTKKITEQYPENRKTTLVIPDRFRGQLTMPHDDNNEHACTACGICQMNCPNGTIKVISKSIETEEGKKKKILDRYTYDLGMCTFCNLCVITCPQDAIQFSNEFENSMFRRSSLQNTLNAEGSKLREKKKAEAPAPKKEVAPKTEDAPVAKTTEKSAPVVVEEKKKIEVDEVAEKKVETPKTETPTTDNKEDKE